MESANLDFLRASAVLVVLAFHVLAFFGIRQAGPLDLEAMALLCVYLFFVHTSFVLMLSLERQEARFGLPRLFSIFIVRRCFRIYPLSIFVVGMIVLFRLPLAGHPWSMHWPAPGVKDVLANALLIQNVTSSTSVIGPLWSLPVEMQLYLVMPALFLLARRLKSPWTALLGWVLAAAVMVPWLGAGHGLNLKYVPCFLAGIVGYRFSREERGSRLLPGWPLLVWSSPVLFAWLRNLEVGWLTCLVVGMAVPHFAQINAVWLCRASHTIARYSYGIYLTHYFSIWLAFAKLEFLPWPVRWTIFAAVTIAVPVLLYHVLELPMVNAGRNLAELRLASLCVQPPAGKKPPNPAHAGAAPSTLVKSIATIGKENTEEREGVSDSAAPEVRYLIATTNEDV